MNRSIEKLLEDMRALQREVDKHLPKRSYGGQREAERLKKIREDAIGHRDKPGLDRDPNV